MRKRKGGKYASPADARESLDLKDEGRIAAMLLELIDRIIITDDQPIVGPSTQTLDDEEDQLADDNEDDGISLGDPEDYRM